MSRHSYSISRSRSDEVWVAQIMKTQNDLKHSQFLSDYWIYCVLFGNAFYRLFIGCSVCTHSVCSHIHAFISIIDHDDQMEQSTCQSTENIVTLPKHFLMCNCKGIEIGTSALMMVCVLLFFVICRDDNRRPM